MKKRVTVKTSKFVLLIVAVFLCIAIARLLYISLSSSVDGINLKKFASSRNTITKKLYANRGTIYDKDGDVLASSVNSYTLIAYLEPSRTTNPEEPHHVIDKDYTAKMLAPILGIDEETILSYLNKKAYQVEFGPKGKNLTEVVKKKIEDLELPGIDFILSTQRYYKMGSFASYIVGYSKTNEEGAIVGELGVESYFNQELSGTDGEIKYEKDAYGYMLPNRPYYEIDAKSGNDIYLTLDSNIQLICENAISNLKDNYEFEWAFFTVMDAKTGAIVASSTYPTFNPNDLNTLTSYLNPLVSYTYEPGSTMKIFSWASIINEGKYNGSELYDSGCIPVADVKICDYNKTGWGKISYDTGFAYSSNVAASKIALTLGKDKLADYYDKFGFGKKTGISLSAEAEGITNFNYKSELATAAFGQGVTVTPVEMLQALSMITNDGSTVKPYIVDKIVDEEGNIISKSSRQVVSNAVTKETAKKMQELMYKANYEGLSNMWQPSTVSMMIKTGTAQIPSPKGGYLDGKYDNIYSLAGIFPAENPRYIMYTAVKKIIAPQRGYANIVTKAVDEIASYANLTNEAKVEETSQNLVQKTDNYISKKTEEVSNSLIEKGLQVITLGTGKYIINQYPLKNTNVVKGEKIFLLTNSKDYIMPNMTGWSASDVKTFASLTGLNTSVNGYGYVISQSLPEGTPIDENSSLEVSLLES